MASKATIYKVLLNIANMDSHYYAEHPLTMAQHPSETELRLMVRLIAFTLNASEDLLFTKGISQEDEPDLYRFVKDAGDNDFAKQYNNRGSTMERINNQTQGEIWKEHKLISIVEYCESR